MTRAETLPWDEKSSSCANKVMSVFRYYMYILYTFIVYVYEAPLGRTRIYVELYTAPRALCLSNFSHAWCDFFFFSASYDEHVLRWERSKEEF